MATEKQIKAFIDMLAPLAVKVCKERGYGNAQAWTCVAQACCESAYGTSNLMKNANAFLGIKATKSWVNKAKYGGLVYNTKTKECYDGKNYVVITDCFRAYKNPEDCVRDYFDLIELPRYKNSLKANSVQGAITCIKNGGYATSPTYISTICNFYKKSQKQIESYRVTDDNTHTSDNLKKVCQDVINGKYGTGEVRKKALTDAGYDYKEVQKMVNDMLR